MSFKADSADMMLNGGFKMHLKNKQGAVSKDKLAPKFYENFILTSAASIIGDKKKHSEGPGKMCQVCHVKSMAIPKPANGKEILKRNTVLKTSTTHIKINNQNNGYNWCEKWTDLLKRLRYARRLNKLIAHT